MIDPLENKTRIVNSAHGVPTDTPIVRWTFQADEDLTLREVHFYLEESTLDPTKALPQLAERVEAILSTDPSLTLPAGDQTNFEFQLNSLLKRNWENLAFPVPRGTRLYWGTASQNNFSQLITLIFT